jgi:hypothetical protein
MIFSFLKKAPSPQPNSPTRIRRGFAVDLSPQGEVAGSRVAKRHLSLWGRGRPAGSGEGALKVFSEESCAIWNDINRALDAKPRSEK